MLKLGTENNAIEFKIEVENTTLDKVNPRLVVEVNNTSTILPLKVDSNGVVKANIPLEESWEGKKGNLKLEIINESNYFVPFEKEVEFSGIVHAPKAVVTEVKTISKPAVARVKTTSKIETPTDNTLLLKKEAEKLIKESKVLLEPKKPVYKTLKAENQHREIYDFFKNKS